MGDFPLFSQDTNIDIEQCVFFCFVDGTIFQLRGGDTRVCNQEKDQPATNFFAETHGPGSRCVEHGRQWFQTRSGTNSTLAVYGGGCYKVWLMIKLTYTYLLSITL